MKCRWNNGLRAIVLLGLTLGGARLHAQTPPESQSSKPGELRLTALRVVAEDGKVLQANLQELPLKVGQPLQPEEVAASIRILYQTGNYADLRAVTYPESDGVRLDFIARENLYFNQVLINGLTPPPTEASAVAAMQLSLGQTYHEQDVKDGVERLRDALRDEGLYQAKISVEERPFPATHQLDVIVNLVPGPRVRAKKIDLVNNSGYRDSELLARFKLKSGSPLTIAKVQSGTERIRKFLEKKGHLSARVSVRRGEYDSPSNTIPLALEVTEGPRVRVALVGAKLKSRDLRKMIPVYQEGSVDADLLEEGRRNIRERMEREGYFDASVDYAVTARDVEGAKTGKKGSEEIITYTVQRGSRHQLSRIEFKGNRYFSTDLLKSRLTISTVSLFTRPRFSRRLMDADALSMKNLYISNGFLSAKVEGQVEEGSGKKGADLIVRFNIVEGKQTLVSSLQVEGVRALPEEEIRGVLGSLPGQPFSDINVSSDRDNVLALYYNQGFPNATFAFTTEPDSSPESQAATDKANAKEERLTGEARKYAIERAQPVKLFYKIVEGQRISVKNVFLTGYKHTRQRVIRREVKVTPGGPLREGEVVESQQKLYNLGVFNRVTIEPQNANGTNPEKDIVVLVEEAKRFTIAYGGGFEVQRLASTTDPTGGEIQAAPRGILEISKQNVTGRADSLALKLRGSTIQGRALLAYNAPNTFNISKLSTQANAYVEKTQDINTFGQTRYEGNVQLTDQVTPRSSLLFRYVFRKVTVSNLNIPAEEVPLFNQPTLVSEFGATYVRDYRDNPADATKGSFSTADISAAATSIGSSASFLRYFVQNSTYTPLSKNWNFARALRIGILQPYGNTVSLSFPAPTVAPLPQLIPLPERLFAGGGTSIRGFALNQAGPRDALTGFPVGGEALVLFNQEIRFPLKLPVIGTKLGGALFYDAGNVYSRASRVTLRWSPPKPVFVAAIPGQPPGPFNPTRCVANCTNELNYFSHTIGFGLRYATPIGPIRIDMGYQLNPAEFVIPCQNSRAFCQQGAHLQKFQIFFNLGSSF
ncbi:MAG TPA: POTRA domain-containing protein [Candidatus Limnocylindrales bacterium]|nr:POTRA domain-containing protein [Candidatus Limnocylindrales bacterium]